MLYLFVQVNESIKCILSERVVSIEPTNNQFSDLFEAITFGQYIDREVQVFIRREKTESWREVNNGLNGDLEMMSILGLTQVKFCLIENANTEMPVSAPNNEPNAFNILMNNSRKLLLPQCCTEYNGRDRLFNEIIELFQSQKVDWMGGMHNMIGKLFLNRITDYVNFNNVINTNT